MRIYAINIQETVSPVKQSNVGQVGSPQFIMLSQGRLEIAYTGPRKANTELTRIDQQTHEGRGAERQAKT